MKLKHKIIILLLVCFSLSSCLLEPKAKSSKLTLLLNGKDITNYIQSNMLRINLDAPSSTPDELSPSGFLEFTLTHSDEKGNIIPADVNFSLPGISLTSRSSNTASLTLEASVLPIGINTLTMTSSLGNNFNKTLDIWVFSSVNEIYAQYTLENPINSLTYTNPNDKDEPCAISGEIKGEDGVIYLATNSSYEIDIKALNNSTLGALTLNTVKNDSDGLPYLRWSNISDTKKRLTTSGERTDEAIITKYKEKGLTTEIREALPYFEIILAGSLKKIKRYVILRQYTETQIIESETKNNSTKYISLSLADGVKNYEIQVQGTLSDGPLQFALPYGTQEELSSSPIPPSDGWSTNTTRYGKFNTGNTELTYFDIYFNGKTRELIITPRINTIHNDKNINFYLHVKDSAGNYLGWWRIMIGGIVESIQLSIDSLEGKPAQSGTIKAEVFPHNAECDVLWYISESPHNSNGSDMSPNPTEDVLIKNMVSMLPYPVYRQNPTDPSKQYTINLKNRGGATNTYFNTMAASPATKNGISTLVYSLGSISGKAYLTAIACKVSPSGDVEGVENYTIYTSIPITISSNGEVAFRSEMSVNNQIKDSNGNYFNLDQYKDENMRPTILPRRLSGQYYPDTLEDSKYGVLTRSFYFPHDSVSTLYVDLFGTDEMEFSYTPSKEAQKLFTIEQTEEPTGYALTITPLIHQYYINSETNTIAKKPPTNKSESVEGYGDFSKYIGVGYVNIKVNGTNGILRIVIYDNNVYPENLIG